MNRKDAKPGRLKTAVLSWLGLNTNLYGAPLLGETASTGAEITAESVLKLPTAWACGRIVSQTLSAFDLGLYEKLDDGTNQPRPDHPVSRVVSRSPNSDMTAVLFWESLISQALFWGNGFAEKKYVGGRLVALDLLVCERLMWRRLPGGAYEFGYVDFDGKRRTIPERDIFHVPGYAVTGRFGLSVIRYGANLFGMAESSNTAAAATFKNGLLPTTYFKMDGTVKERQRQQFRENLEEISGALNAGKSPLLEAGMDVGDVGINPADAQLLESRTFTAGQICQWFGVPPPLVGITDKASSWASSSEQMNLWFLQYGLLPWIRRIESAIWKQLLTPAEQVTLFAKFKYEDLLRADTVARAQFYASGLQNGWINRNTVARKEDLPMIPGGDVYTVQSNLIPLDRLDDMDDSAQLRSAMQNFLNNGEGNDED